MLDGPTGETGSRRHVERRRRSRGTVTGERRLEAVGDRDRGDPVVGRHSRHSRPLERALEAFDPLVQLGIERVAAPFPMRPAVECDEPGRVREERVFAESRRRLFAGVGEELGRFRHEALVAGQDAFHPGPDRFLPQGRRVLRQDRLEQPGIHEHQLELEDRG